MTDYERVIAVIANAGLAIGIGHYWLGAPVWATVMWLSLENGIVSLRPKKKS